MPVWWTKRTAYAITRTGFDVPDSGFITASWLTILKENKAIRDFLRDTLTPFYETHLRRTEPLPSRF